ncbi:MAG TPA: SUMF1/EgtB/PvdO family nonheme iron enzyme [Labilithrix sp.]
MNRPSATLVGSALLLVIAFCGRNDVEAAPASTAPTPDAPSDLAPDLPGLVSTGEIAGEDHGELRAEPQRTWRLVNGRHWQIVAPRGEEPSVTDARERNRGACQAGMIEVSGKMKMHAMMDELQQQTCTKWIDRKWPERCGEYDRDAWLKLSKDLPTRDEHFCIDRFEYPNRKNEYPIILVSWYEARDACKAEGKRLCSEDEWTFACEGEEATPYPNGYVRDPDACVNDRPWKLFHGEALMSRSSKAAMMELDRLWQGVPSGTRASCKSSFGVYDLTGNVDEWTRSSVPGERPSVLKGGYWGPVRTRCRPATKAHGEEHTFYQQGFRCCADPGK